MTARERVTHRWRCLECGHRRTLATAPGDVSRTIVVGCRSCEESTDHRLAGFGGE